MRLIGLGCAAAAAITMCSPAAADCHWFKVIIGEQASDEASATKVAVNYDIQAKKFTISGEGGKTGELLSYCEQDTLILYETPKISPKISSDDKDAKQTTKDDGVCWLAISRNKLTGDTVKGACFRRSPQAITMTGRIY
jgi:hypothetical protein